MKKYKKILITGGAGFIGSCLADRLIEKGFKVVVVDDLSSGKKENINKQAKFYKKDICNPDVSKIFKKEKPKIVFHLAAKINLQESLEDPAKDLKTNVFGTINVLENCKKYNVKKIIFASSCAVYGEAKIPVSEKSLPKPLFPYGINKLCAEKYLDYYHSFFNLPFIALRFSNVYGPRQNSKGESGVVAVFCDKLISGKTAVIYGSGFQTRDFIFVKDAVNALIAAKNSRKTGVFNIGTGKENSVNNVFLKISKILGAKTKAKRKKFKQKDQNRSLLDVSLAKKELKWKPEYSFEEGIKKTLDWFRDRK